MTLLQRERTTVDGLPATTLTFSIIIPTYNECDDIAATLACARGQTLPATDIVVVDGGSTDGTREFLAKRAAAGEITFIDEGARRGVAAARNAGIRAASGDVAVVLNADVLLPRDFCARLVAHYRDGVDALSVDARVANMDALTGRYIQAMHEDQYAADRVGWSEGFSCRRHAALAAGFPEEIPGAGGEDVEFLERLVAAGYRWDVDYTICVEHRVPATLRGFAAQFRGRGRAVPYADTRLCQRAFGSVVLRRLAATAWTLASFAVVAPHALAALRLARHSPHGLADAPGFWVLRHVLFASHRLGEWESIVRIAREGREAQRCA